MDHCTSEEERRNLFAQNFAKAYYGRKLDCGHKPTAPEHLHPHGMPMTTGYGRDRETGETFCYECAHDKERELVRKSDKVFAYLSSDGKRVQDWPGGVLSDRVCVLSEGRDNFGGERIYLRFEFEGTIFSGFAMGRGAYLRAKRTKLKSLWA
jgi:hypothetical protein